MEEQAAYISLPEFSELHFDENKHLYTLQKAGVTLELPSVTQILRFVSREFYDGVPQPVLEQAADRGTRVHEAIEAYADFGWLEKDDDTAPYILAYEAWEKDHNFQTVASEYRLYHRTRLYAGTADMIFIEEGNLSLLDFKTSQTVLEGLTAAQLYGYAEALKSHGVNIEKTYILHLKNDATYEFIPVDARKGQMIFDACAFLHGAIKGGPK